jgi:hypothetical protein
MDTKVQAMASSAKLSLAKARICLRGEAGVLAARVEGLQRLVSEVEREMRRRVAGLVEDNWRLRVRAEAMVPQAEAELLRGRLQEAEARRQAAEESLRGRGRDAEAQLAALREEVDRLLQTVQVAERSQGVG